MSTPGLNFDERINAAIRRLNTSHRKYAQILVKGGRGSEVAVSNIQAIRRRKRELSELCGHDSAFWKRAGEVEKVEILLKPLELEGENTPRKRNPPRARPAPSSQIFRTGDARRSRTGTTGPVEMNEEDESDDEEGEGGAGLDQPVQRAVSVASTGSNIAVYRPPSPPPPQATPDAPPEAPPEAAPVAPFEAAPEAPPEASTASASKASDFSWATSSGNGLFVSDKKRPKKHKVKVVEGAIIGEKQ